MMDKYSATPSVRAETPPVTVTRGVFGVAVQSIADYTIMQGICPPKAPCHRTAHEKTQGCGKDVVKDRVL